MDTKQALLRKLPAIGVVLEQSAVKELERKFGHAIVAEAASEVVRDLRELILNASETPAETADMSEVIVQVSARVLDKIRPSLRKVINATGVVLHTNLGRAVLAKAAVDAITDVAGSYSNLEFDLVSGERGTRYAHVEELLCRLTGAAAGLVVNNNAAAVLLILNTLAQGREAVVSRGQLVEIGGSFRIPDVMAQSGAVLREVGTTNKTHLRDYESAVNENTGLLLKVHTSNYKIIGFTSEVTAQELVALGREKNVPVYEDLGSGVLVDFGKLGVAHEPTVGESLAAGVDVVSCSGDKLFGGPQAGIIVGRADLIARIRKNPLTRALRVDKFTLAAMEATLRLYLDEEKALREIPTLNMITMAPEELRIRAEKLYSCFQAEVGNKAVFDIVEGFSYVGGGALPEEKLPTYLVSLEPSDISVNALEKHLRRKEPPVLTRVQKDRLLFDPRTLLDGEAGIIACHLKEILKGSETID